MTRSSGQWSVVSDQSSAHDTTRVICWPRATGHWPLHVLTLSVAVFLACAWPAVPALAQDRLEHRVSLDLKAMAPRDAFGVIADAIGYSVDVAAEVSTPVDILVSNVRARTALDTICDSIGCAWRATGTTIVVSPQPSRVRMTGRIDPKKNADRHAAIAELRRRVDAPLPADVTFQDAPLTEVAERLSSATGLEITFSVHDPLKRSLRTPGSEMTLTADLSRLPLVKALETVSERLEGVVIGIAVRDDPEGKPAGSVRILMRWGRKPAR